jgi:hypothetical protein
MQMPPLHGNFIQSDTAFFIAADENYFNVHARPLINSIRQNFKEAIHFHLYNPSDHTKNFCAKSNISYSFEYFDENSVGKTFQTYENVENNSEMIRRRSKMLKDGDNISKLHTELVRTYYACARFVRLYELLSKPTYIIMLDVDSLVRLPFFLPSTMYDIHIFEKKHKKHVSYVQHLASTIFYTGTKGSFNLIRDHAGLIREEFAKDSFYWFLDQETLDIAIQKYQKNPLNQNFVDFDMNSDSYIWCAKGPRKNKLSWINEVSKFQVL